MGFYGSQHAGRRAAQQCARHGQAEAGRGNDPLKPTQPGSHGAEGRCRIGWSLSLGVTQQWKQQDRGEGQVCSLRAGLSLSWPPDLTWQYWSTKVIDLYWI